MKLNDIVMPSNAKSTGAKDHGEFRIPLYQSTDMDIIGFTEIV